MILINVYLPRSCIFHNITYKLSSVVGYLKILFIFNNI